MPAPASEGAAEAGSAKLLGKPLQAQLCALAWPPLEASPLVVAHVEDPPSRRSELGELATYLGLETRIRGREPGRRWNCLPEARIVEYSHVVDKRSDRPLRPRSSSPSARSLGREGQACLALGVDECTVVRKPVADRETRVAQRPRDSSRSPRPTLAELDHEVGDSRPLPRR